MRFDESIVLPVLCSPREVIATAVYGVLVSQAFVSCGQVRNAPRPALPNDNRTRTCEH